MVVVPSPSLVGTGFGEALRMGAILLTNTMQGVISSCVNLDALLSPVGRPMVTLAAPCSSTNSLMNPTIP